MTIDEEQLGALDHRTMLAHDYAIINRMQVEPAAYADLDGPPIVPARHASRTQQFPLLVELRSLSDTRRIGLIDRMSSWHASRGTPYFGALLTCSDDVDTLCRHLIKRSDVRLPDGSRDVLRWHDPRVFGHLRWIFEPKQMSVALGNIQRWTWCQPDGAWRSLVHADARASLRANRLVIDPRQWPSIMRLPDINHVMAALRSTSSGIEDDADLARQVNTRLAEAERNFSGSNAADRKLYAEHVLRFGEKLYQHPETQPRMARVHAGKQNYFSAFAVFDDESLRAMAVSPEFAKECS